MKIIIIKRMREIEDMTQNVQFICAIVRFEGIVSWQLIINVREFHETNVLYFNMFKNGLLFVFAYL